MGQMVRCKCLVLAAVLFNVISLALLFKHHTEVKFAQFKKRNAKNSIEDVYTKPEQENNRIVHSSHAAATASPPCLNRLMNFSSARALIFSSKEATVSEHHGVANPLDVSALLESRWCNERKKLIVAPDLGFGNRMRAELVNCLCVVITHGQNL